MNRSPAGTFGMRNNCRACAIRDHALCRALPDTALAKLNQMARRRTVRAGSRIFDGADDPPHVANVVSGVVRLSKSLPDGRNQIVGLQFPTEFIGAPFNTDRSLLTEAATAVELCIFTQRQFEGLLDAHPGLKDLLLQRTITQLDRAREWMLLLGRKTAEERVASLILLCMERLHGDACSTQPTAGETTFDLPLSRTEMADFLGLTLETVGRMMKRLEQAEVIKIGSNRRVSVPDRATLVTRAQNEQG